MKITPITGLVLPAVLLLLFFGRLEPAYGQDFDSKIPLIDRVNKTPDDVLEKFYDEGMRAQEHALSTQERADVNAAFKMLPALHQRILRERLAGICFLDSMPCTGLKRRPSFIMLLKR